MRKAQRIISRECIMKLLYQVEITKVDINNIEGLFSDFIVDHEEYIKDRYEELVLQNSNDPNVKVTKETAEEMVDEAYVKLVLTSIRDNKQTIDEKIEKYAKNWTITRMPKVDLSILRLAIGELLYVNEIPIKVSINEAVELAKDYCDDKTPKFINGILGSIANEIER